MHVWGLVFELENWSYESFGAGTSSVKTRRKKKEKNPRMGRIKVYFSGRSLAPYGKGKG